MQGTWSVLIRLMSFYLAGAGLALAQPSMPCAENASERPGLIATEYAFAERARTSVRSAFLDYLAEDAVILQPGPVPGRPLYLASKESKDELEWYPSIGGHAGSDDLGFTAGPWTYKAAVSGAQGWGHFVTLWRRDSQCRWRVQFDGGVSHAAPSAADERLTSDPTDFTVSEPPAPELIAQDSVNRAISDFQSAARSTGFAAGLRTFARNGDFILYADGERPMSLGPAALYLESRGAAAESWYEFSRGRSADSTLAYSVGEFSSPKRHDRSAYVQIWQYDAKVANWGVRLLLVAPLPREKKS